MMLSPKCSSLRVNSLSLFLCLSLLSGLAVGGVLSTSSNFTLQRDSVEYSAEVMENTDGAEMYGTVGTAAVSSNTSGYVLYTGLQAPIMMTNPIPEPDNVWLVK